MSKPKEANKSDGEQLKEALDFAANFPVPSFKWEGTNAAGSEPEPLACSYHADCRGGGPEPVLCQVCEKPLAETDAGLPFHRHKAHCAYNITFTIDELKQRAEAAEERADTLQLQLDREKAHRAQAEQDAAAWERKADASEERARLASGLVQELARRVEIVVGELRHYAAVANKQGGTASIELETIRAWFKTLTAPEDEAKAALDAVDGGGGGGEVVGG